MWKLVESNCLTFQCGDFPELIHIIKTGFKDKYIVVWEDAHEHHLGSSKIYNRAEILETFGLDVDQHQTTIA